MFRSSHGTVRRRVAQRSPPRLYEAINPHDMVGETFHCRVDTLPLGERSLTRYLRRSGMTST